MKPQNFLNDPRIQEAKRLMIAAITDAQAEICQIKAADLDKTVHYQTLLDRFKNCRAAELYYPYISSGLGHGAYVQLADGSVKLDFINGIGVHAGHSIPELIEANLDAALEDTVMQGNLQQNLNSLILCEKLTSYSKMDHCFLTSSGAMAVENALKIAFQNRYPAKRILAFKGCFSGRTLSLSQVTDKAAYRVGLPATIAVDYLPFYDANRHQESIDEACMTLKTLCKRYPQDYAAIVMELIQGEGGYYKGHPEFFNALSTLCKEEGILCIVDEIQSFGRTESLFASQYFDLKPYPDIITIGKLSQVCATLFNATLAPKPGLISQTFTSSSTAINSSLKLLELFETQNIFGPNGKIHECHQYFVEKLKALSQKFPDRISGPYGCGSMIAFTPLDGDKTKVQAVAKLLFDNGLMGFIAGETPCRIRFLLPILVIQKKDIDTAVSIIEQTIQSI